jgi:CDP-glycerol glycerophosphotransferase (TagB/SpsB family)
MNLCKLDKENHVKIADKKIVCYEYSSAYLDELKAEFPDVYEHISLVVDDYKRNQGDVEIAGKNVSVKNSDYLTELDIRDYALLITSDYFTEGYEKIEKLLGSTDEDITVYFYPNKETKYEMVYRERFSSDSLEDIIIFRSGPHASAYVKGMDFADNARALFEYMLANNYNSKYKLVWFVKNPEEFESYKKYENVCFYSFDWSVSEDEAQRDLYYDALCHASHIFFTDAYGFARNCRKDQVRIQLWHGCGFKTRTNFVPCEKRYEYNIVISEKYSEIHQKIYGLKPEQILLTGYPKQDSLFHPVGYEKLAELGIPKSDKYIFWLPTFRVANDKLSILNEYELVSETGLPVVYKKSDFEMLNELLKKNNITLVVKLHPFQKKHTVNIGRLSNVILLENDDLVDVGVEINDILGWADALISDYSSAAIDYLILDRPIAFTLDDVDDYSAGRGFVFDDLKAWLPGKEIFSKDDFVAYIEEIINNVDSSAEKRKNIREKLHKYGDDQSCRRLLEILGITRI